MPFKSLDERRAWRRAYQQQYRLTHPRPERADVERRRAGERRRAAALRAKLLALFGGVCAHCGFTDPRALQIDHVNGGGRRHIHSFSSVGAYYRAVLASGGSGFQLLCANCNAIKKVERGEHHRPE